jgi:diguanylate cyclase (GGDEF)-like protein
MKIVIIDDSSINLMLIKAYLKKLEKSELFTFTNPRKALAWCSTNDPDMILVDYLMPDLDGLEFIRYIREKSALNEVPLVMITAYHEKKNVLYEALRRGANDFLTQPVDPIELEVRTRNMLKLRARALALAEANARLQELATLDALTNVYNRRHFLELAHKEFARARRYQTLLSVIMLDVDHFKRINDSHGHAGGDEVLKALAQICRREIREIDVFGRLGGEEFAICLPGTPLRDAQQVAERLRCAIATATVPVESAQATFTVSLGVAEFRDEDKDFAALLRRADLALYEAKEMGRNRVAVQQ